MALRLLKMASGGPGRVKEGDGRLVRQGKVR